MRGHFHFFILAFAALLGCVSILKNPSFKDPSRPNSQVKTSVFLTPARSIRQISSGREVGDLEAHDRAEPARNGERHVESRLDKESGPAEIYLTHINGGDEEALTHLKAMARNPAFHPSGAYVIFSVAQGGAAQSELYIVDSLGRQEPVRVTEFGGHNDEPEFALDGESLHWVHATPGVVDHTRGSRQAQWNEEAQWNDALARRLLKLEPLKPRMSLLSSAIDENDARTWVEYLASEHLEGRATGSAMENEYMETLAQGFKDLELKPLAKDFIEKYDFTSGVELEEPNRLEIQLAEVSEHPAVAGDWVPLSYSKIGHFGIAPLVFAGYGIVAPAFAPEAAYDSYGGLEVKDKWVLVFSGVPEDLSEERRYHLQTFAHPEFKATLAQARGAAGLLIVEDSRSPTQNLRMTFEGRGADVGIPVVRLSARLGDRLFASAKSSRSGWTERLAKGDVTTMSFDHVAVEADVHLKLRKATARNVLAILQVPGATTTVVVGAHGDHLGHGQLGHSLWHGRAESIHFGADDNASGVAAVMEIAQDLSEKVKNKDLTLKQNVLFAIWSGEELGRLGSTAFLAQNKDFKISAYLNLDRIGRYRDQLLILGAASALEWPTRIEGANANFPLPLRVQPDPFFPTDSLAFYERGVPSLSLFTGSHPQFHTPADKPDLIDYQGLDRIAHWAERLTIQLASSAEPAVRYHQVEAKKKGSESRPAKLYLGTIPDYSREVKFGVALAEVHKNSPADKAALHAGDVIVELGGNKVQNIYDFVYAVQSLKAGVRTTIKILRRGRERSFPITPVLRD